MKAEPEIATQSAPCKWRDVQVYLTSNSVPMGIVASHDLRPMLDEQGRLIIVDVNLARAIAEAANARATAPSRSMARGYEATIARKLAVSLKLLREFVDRNFPFPVKE